MGESGTERNRQIHNRPGKFREWFSFGLVGRRCGVQGHADMDAINSICEVVCRLVNGENQYRAQDKRGIETDAEPQRASLRCYCRAG